MELREESCTPRVALAAGVVVLFALLIYLPALRFELLSWDDKWYVTHNPLIRGLDWANLKAIFTEAFSANFLPLHLLSYAVDYAIWGGDSSFGFHLSSILINALSSGLALLVLLKLGVSLRVALAGALLFSLHHGHVSSVAWVSSRKGVLALFFVFGCMLAYLHAHREQERSNWGWYGLAVLLYGCSVMSKLTMMLVFLFLFTHNWLSWHGFRFPGWKALRRLLLLQLPFVLVGLIMAMVNTAAQVTSNRQYGVLEFLCVKGEAIWRYFAVLAGIHTGQPVYSHPLPASGLQAVSLILAVVLIPLLFAWLWRCKSQTGFLASTWILVMLLPALAFPLVTFMADRYLYAASFGFCWLIAEAAHRLSKGQTAKFVAIVALPMLVFGVRFSQYLPVWKDSETLMRFANARCDDFRVREHLASALMVRGAYAEVEEILAADTERGLYAATRILAHSRYLQQDFVGAEPLYEHCVAELRAGGGALIDTLERSSDLRSGLDVWRNLGHILLEGPQPRPRETISLLEPVATEMQDARIFFYLGTAYYRLNDHRQAVDALTHAWELAQRETLDPSWVANCGFSLGAGHWSLKEREQARAVWRSALSFDPQNATIAAWLKK
jgi:tetratricopeptide (TPR) repeat protein